MWALRLIKKKIYPIKVVELFNLFTETWFMAWLGDTVISYEKYCNKTVV